MNTKSLMQEEIVKNKFKRKNGKLDEKLTALNKYV